MSKKEVTPMIVKDLLKAIKKHKIDKNCEIMVEQRNKEFKVYDLGVSIVTCGNEMKRFLLIDITKNQDWK